MEYNVYAMGVSGNVTFSMSRPQLNLKRTIAFAADITVKYDFTD